MFNLNNLQIKTFDEFIIDHLSKILEGFFLYITIRNLVICNQSLCNWHATKCAQQWTRVIKIMA